MTFTFKILEFAAEVQRSSDMKQGGTEFDISPGDKVLVRQLQNRDSKILIRSVDCEGQQGNSLTLDADGVEYRRHITHVKTFFGGQDDDPHDSTKTMWNPNKLQRIEMQPSDTEACNLNMTLRLQADRNKREIYFCVSRSI